MINLLAEKKIKFDHKSGVVFKIKFWSKLILIVYTVGLGLILSINQVILLKVDRVDKALNDARLQIASKVLLIYKYESLIDRAKMIDKILTKRKESVGIWNTVRGILPSGIDLTEFGLNGNVLSLSFLSPHVVATNDLIQVIETQLHELNFDEIKMDVNRSDDASYIVNAELILH